MSEGVDLRIRTEGHGPGARRFCQVRLDRKHDGRKVTFSFERKVHVKDSRPVHESKPLFTHTFTAGSAGEQEFELPEVGPEVYSYSGPHIDVQILVKVVVDDGYIWDTTVETAIGGELYAQPRASTCAKAIIDPEDEVDYWKNLEALDEPTRWQAMFVGLAGTLFLCATLGVAGHDLLCGYGETWLFPDDGVGTFFIAFFMVIFGAAITGAWVFSLMGSYMDLEAKNLPGGLDRDWQPRVSDLFSGKTHVQLSDLTFRIVACNRECGQYVRGSGTNRRTISFQEPLRGVMLFEQKVPYLPKGVDPASYLDERIDLGAIFDELYPPQMASTTHGVDLYWELQVIHPHLVDKELALETKGFDLEAFRELPEGPDEDDDRWS